MIACCLSIHLLSVYLSVTLVDQNHIGWKVEILQTQIISPTPLLFVSQGEHREILWRLEMGWGKVACWRTKAAVSLKRVKIDEKLVWRAYRNSPSPTPYGLIFPKIWGSRPSPKTPIQYEHALLRVHCAMLRKHPPVDLVLLLSQEWVKLRTSNLARIFTGSIQTKAC